MISFLDGTIVEKQPTRVVMDIGGVGYEVLIPLSSFERLPAEGGACRILTHDHVREDQRTLYGFWTEEERDAFRMLLSISGVGPKLALSALSGLTVRDLRKAVAEGDAKRLSTIPGVGRKTAERIVVDLRDKMGPADDLAGSATDAVHDSRLRDAISALVSLAYKEADARGIVAKVIRSVPADATVEDIIRKSLAQ
jgi:Holliday junction DNA helicase RuvA